MDSNKKPMNNQVKKDNVTKNTNNTNNKKALTPPKPQNTASERPKEAIALSYDKASKMPAIVAKGRGHVADRIIKEAKKANVPIYDNVNVAENLGKLDIGAFIPPEMFEVIAQIYIFVDKLENILDDDIIKKNDTDKNK